MYRRFHGRRLQGQTSDLKYLLGYSQSHSQYLQIAILTIHQYMPEGIFHEMHRRRNIRPPATTDQALWAARPKGRPRA